MSLVPRWYNRLPRLLRKKGGTDFLNLGKFFEDLEEDLAPLGHYPSGISVSCDDKHIYIEANVPGLTAQEVDVSLDNEGILWIKGEKKEEKIDKEKKFYHRAQHSFSYCVPLFEEIDPDAEPKATCKNGVMYITFAKRKEKQVVSKKIPVKEEK